MRHRRSGSMVYSSLYLVICFSCLASYWNRSHATIVMVCTVSLSCVVKAVVVQRPCFHTLPRFILITINLRNPYQLNVHPAITCSCQCSIERGKVDVIAALLIFIKELFCVLFHNSEEQKIERGIKPSAAAWRSMPKRMRTKMKEHRDGSKEGMNGKRDRSRIWSLQAIQNSSCKIKSFDKDLRRL